MNERSQADVAAETSGRRLLTTQEASVIAKVSVHTMRNWVKWQWVEVVYTASGLPRIVEDSLHRATKERT